MDQKKTKPTFAHKGCPPPTPAELEDIWKRWYQAMELSNAMLMSGLRAQAGPDGNIAQLYRDWYDRYQAAKWNNAGKSKHRGSK